MNLSLVLPPRVTSLGFFARLGTALGGLLLDEPAPFPVPSDMSLGLSRSRSSATVSGEDKRSA